MSPFRVRCLSNFSRDLTLTRRIFRILAHAAAIPLLLLPAIAPAGLLRVDPVHEDTPFVPDEAPVTLLLSKSRYPAEDRHLDAIAWMQPPVGVVAEGELRLSLHDAEGRALSGTTIRPLPGDRLFFSYAFPENLAGQAASLRAVWMREDREAGRAQAAFDVHPAAAVARSGRVPLQIPNDGGAVFRGLPVTVGVPFPRGALVAAERVRLVDETDTEIPMQTKVTSRWSRFGSIRWLQCDFTVDLHGAPLTLFLEYGPDVERSPAPALGLSYPDLSAGEPPAIDAGPIRFTERDGIAFDPGDGQGYRNAVPAASLHGAFVEHENGKRFVLPAETAWEIEERGSRKIVLRRRGWYRDPGSEARFCRFDTRYEIHHGSPVVRILHTWIFTGYPYEDLYTWAGARRIERIPGAGDADRIRNMGWRFDLSDGLRPEGFLTSFGTEGDWRAGDYQLQHDFDQSEVVDEGAAAPGGRAPGVAAAAGGGMRMLLGVRDFWQNFPNELEFTDGALFFHQWPRHGRPAGTHPPRVADGLRLWFAHEGEVLDFAIPREYTDEPDFQRANPNRFHLHGFRETMNAQGIAKTDELWLVFADAQADADMPARVLAGLNDGTLRAIVDPAWVAASGTFYEMHPRDTDRFPEEERVYEMHASAPLTWIERMRFYGKWIWGDMWWGARLRERDWTVNHGGSQGLYRGFRKSHQGWPYSWIPFARSGDPRYWRLADAATRHMTDVVFCHYSDERVPPWRGGSREDLPVRPRWRGFYLRHHIPWAHQAYDPSSREYTDKNNYLWHSYYLTGYPRARDVAMDWARLCKTEGSARWSSRGDTRTVFTGPPTAFEASRQSVTQLQSYVEQYQATFDPWFLAAAHQVARNHLRWFREDGWLGHFWNPGPREFHRFTGSDEYAEFYLAYARAQADQHLRSAHANWAWHASNIEPVAYAYRLTGDPMFLDRAAFWVDHARAATYTGEPEYFRGTIVKNAGRNAGPMFTGYFLQHFPFALDAFARAGARPVPEGAFRYCPPGTPIAGTERFAYRYRIALRKETGEAVPLRLSIQQTLWEPDPDFREEFRYRIEDAGGRALLEGAWDVKAGVTVEIPADAPLGMYRLVIRGESRFRPDGSWRQVPSLSLPVSPFGVPEVIELEPGESIARSHPTSQFWFVPPEGLTEFWTAFTPVPNTAGGRDCDLARFSIWDPEGRLAWDEQFPFEARPQTDKVRAVVPVAPGQAGQPWRITVAGLNLGIDLDPAIPRVFSVGPRRWFDPGEP